MIFRRSVRKLKWGTAIRRLLAQVTATSDNCANFSSERADLIMLTREEMKAL